MSISVQATRKAEGPESVHEAFGAERASHRWAVAQKSHSSLWQPYLPGSEVDAAQQRRLEQAVLLCVCRVASAELAETGRTHSSQRRPRREAPLASFSHARTRKHVTQAIQWSI